MDKTKVGGMNSRLLSTLLKLAGEGTAERYDDVLSLASERLQRLAHRMLASFPELKRWEETDDVVQNACIRLHHSLMQVRPDSMARFIGLASTEIRRTLIDLARHHFGPHGQAANHGSNGFTLDEEGRVNRFDPPATSANEPDSLEGWTRFHEAIGRLPDEEREVFELTWFSGLEQHEIVDMTGLSVRTVKRRWRAAKLALYEMLEGVSPLTPQ